MAPTNNAPTKQSAAARIERQLLEDISIGELTPGQRLDEMGLAERFGASRTPVREALSRLTAQGVLVQGKKRGVFVGTFSREELAQIFEAMHEIEAACARIAAQRLTFLSKAEILAAQEACVAAAQADDRKAYLRANEQFHEAIYAATGNPYMAEIAAEFRKRTGPFRAKKFATHDDLIESANSHQALIDNIFSEDSGTASKAMRTHMTHSFMAALKAN